MAGRRGAVKLKYSVTFEFPVKPPLTHRGVVVATTGATCAARAIRQAQKALRPINWSSMVYVALERLDAAPEANEEQV